MKKILLGIIILFTNLSYSQNKVKLRDLFFFVPSEFRYFTGQNKKLNYDNFYEVGIILKDSIDLGKFPKIQYQYYEMPHFGESSSKILTDVNKNTEDKGILQDTLVIEDSKNYSFVKYSVLGKSVFEIKSIGKKGLINIQYFDLPINDKNSLETVKSILRSIRHNENYISKKDNLEYESERLYKQGLILLIISEMCIIIYIFNNKFLRICYLIFLYFI